MALEQFPPALELVGEEADALYPVAAIAQDERADVVARAGGLDERVAVEEGVGGVAVVVADPRGRAVRGDLVVADLAAVGRSADEEGVRRGRCRRPSSRSVISLS